MSALLAVLWVALGAPARAGGPVKAYLTAADGWRLAAVYQKPRGRADVVVLIHGVGAAGGEWEALAVELRRRGYGTLALDLRGPGGSAVGPDGRRGWERFDAERLWPATRRDVEAALEFLRARGIGPARVGLIGGSLGANLASHALAGGRARWAVLLSPGVDYRGVALAALAGRRALLAAAREDVYAYRTASVLAARGEADFFEAPRGHGAQMIADAAFRERLLAWIERAAGTPNDK